MKNHATLEAKCLDRLQSSEQHKWPALCREELNATYNAFSHDDAWFECWFRVSFYQTCAVPKYQERHDATINLRLR